MVFALELPERAVGLYEGEIQPIDAPQGLPVFFCPFVGQKVRRLLDHLVRLAKGIQGGVEGVIQIPVFPVALLKGLLALPGGPGGPGGGGGGWPW